MQKSVKNPDRPYLEDLDSLPFPALHLWQRTENLRKYGTIPYPVMTSRGCVYWCNFCTTVRMFGRRYRMRSPKNVVDELEFLHRNYHATQFTFYDDAFTVDQDRTAQICEEIQRRGLKIKWDCETRVDMVSKELLKNEGGRLHSCLRSRRRRGSRTAWAAAGSSSITVQTVHIRAFCTTAIVGPRVLYCRSRRTLGG